MTTPALIILGDNRWTLRRIPDASIDAVVCDPPYGLGFMGKEWDGGKDFFSKEAARGNTFDHVGGNHNPTSASDAVRTRHAATDTGRDVAVIDFNAPGGVTAA